MYEASGCALTESLQSSVGSDRLLGDMHYGGYGSSLS